MFHLEYAEVEKIDTRRSRLSSSPASSDVGVDLAADSETKRATVGRRTTAGYADDLVAMGIAGAVLAVAFTAWFEWSTYVASIDPAGGLAQRFVLAWMLVAKTMFLLLPGMLAGVLAGRLGWRRTSSFLFASSSALVCFVLLVDLRVRGYTGDGLLHYLQFLDNSGIDEWGGSLGPSLRDGALHFAGIAVAGAVVFFAARRLFAFATQRGNRAGARRACVLAWSVVLTAPLLHRTGLAPVDVAAFDAAMVLSGARVPEERSALAAFEKNLNDELAASLATLHPDSWQPPSTDRDAALPPASARPDVLVLVLESFRYLSFTPDLMPRLLAWSRRGLHLDRHFSSSNCSHLGMYSLMYGRHPFRYSDAIRQPPQLPATMKASGYRTTYTSSMDHRGWERMDEFLSESTFDEMTLFTGSDDRLEWPERDSKTLDHVRGLLREPRESRSPRLVVAFLASTHYPYMYPPAYERHLPVRTVAGSLPEGVVLLQRSARLEPPVIESIFRVDAAAGREGLLNRYKNAAGFLDDSIADLLDGIDLTRTVVVVTGDHGESLWDDGTLAHGLRPSEAGTRVPLFLIGPGVAPRAVATPTSHVDVLPTLLHAVAGTSVEVDALHGRDLLAEGSGADDSIAFVPLGQEEDRAALSMVMVAPEGRLGLRVSSQPTSLEMQGTVDARGTVAASPPPQTDVSRWVPRIASVLATLGRGQERRGLAAAQ